jgi:dihydroorotate dehydrogenase (fumarate)
VLSDSDDLRLPLRWVAILFGRVDADLAITSGIHTSQDVIKGLMAGANVTMMASELLQHGVRRIPQVLNEVVAWLHDHEYESLTQMVGAMSQKHCPEPAAFERANYMKVLDSYRPLN